MPDIPSLPPSLLQPPPASVEADYDRELCELVANLRQMPLNKTVREASARANSVLDVSDYPSFESYDKLSLTRALRKDLGCIAAIRSVPFRSVGTLPNMPGSEQTVLPGLTTAWRRYMVEVAWLFTGI